MKAKISYVTGQPGPIVVTSREECRTQDEKGAFEVLKSLPFKSICFGKMTIKEMG